MTSPSDFGRRLTQLVDDRSLNDVHHAMGAAGKKAALEAVTRDLGPDLRMSNMRSKAKLLSGYDLEPDGVMLHLRPKGLWMLADKGRRRQGTINPKRKRQRKTGRRAAVNTPQGWRALSHYTPSRGLGTIDDAVDIMKIEVPKAATKILIAKIGRL